LRATVNLNGTVMARTRSKNNATASTLGFEAELWRAADALRSNMDTAEYKQVILGLIFLKYISDAFEEKKEVHR
jgi:type I restriction enzyme M protein